MTTEFKTRFRDVRRITLIGAALNLLLAITKMVVGVSARSHALFADGIHSLSDLLTDLLVVLAAQYSNQAADSDHPYGHARIETAVSVLIAVFLISAGFGIALDALRYLYGAKQIIAPGIIALWIAGFSIVIKELLYHATVKVAKRWQSKLLEANAWHHRSDAASSLIVVIGIAASIKGYPFVDALAAILIGVKIVYIGVRIAWSNIRELVDTGVDQDTIQQIRAHITAVPGVCALHQLRTRSMGGTVLLDVHILVESFLSVSEGHHIGEQVRKILMTRLNNLNDITVHIDPEDDEEGEPCAHLPSREEILQRCMERWQHLSGVEHIDNVILHYISGQIFIEAWLSLQGFAEIEQLQHLSERYQRAIQDFSEISSVRLLFH